MKLIQRAGRIAALPGLAEVLEEELLRVMRLRTFSKASVLFRQGEEARAVYLVERGRIRWQRVSADGNVQTLQVAERGDTVGLVALLDRDPYVAEAVAVEESTAWELSAVAFDHVVLRRPELALQFMRLLGSGVRSLVEHVHAMSNRSAQERVTAVLMQRTQEAGTGGVIIPMTHQEIANITGLARETVSRVLADLQRRGAVRLTRSAVAVVDPTVLWEPGRRASSG